MWSPDFSLADNVELANAMSSIKTLLRLNLDGTGLCEETAGLLFRSVLQCNSTLEYLDLLSNELGDRGHECLQQVLPGLKHLRSLSIEALGAYR